MNQDRNCSCTKKMAYAVGIVGSFLIVGGLVWLMIAKTKPAGLGEDRAALRRKNLTEVKSINTEILDNYSVIDANKKIVRVPIKEAKSILIEEWKDAKAGRSNLIARVEKATAVPPKAPEKKSDFE
jgi:hypothetical protein